MDEYVPVACMLHERLEFAVLRRLQLRLSWREDGVERCETVLPLDVATRNGAEWLTVRREDGGQSELRLDRITEAIDQA